MASNSFLARGVDHCLSCDLRRAVVEKLGLDGRILSELLKASLSGLGGRSFIIVLPASGLSHTQHRI